VLQIYSVLCNLIDFDKQIFINANYFTFLDSSASRLKTINFA